MQVQIVLNRTANPHLPSRTDQSSARAPQLTSPPSSSARPQTEDCDCFFQFISVTLNAQQTRHTRRRRRRHCLHLPQQQRRNQIKIKLSGFHCKQISLHLIITDAVAANAAVLWERWTPTNVERTAGGRARRAKKRALRWRRAIGKSANSSKEETLLPSGSQAGRQLLTLTLALPLSLFLWSPTHLHGTRAISISYITVWRSLPRDPFTTHQFACTHTMPMRVPVCVCVCVYLCLYEFEFRCGVVLEIAHLYHLFMYISVPAYSHTSRVSRTDICLSVSTVCTYACTSWSSSFFCFAVLHTYVHTYIPIGNVRM